MIRLTGKVGSTTYVIQELERGGFRVFIGGISRAYKKTLTGAMGVVRKIGKAA